MVKIELRQLQIKPMILSIFQTKNIEILIIVYHLNLIQEKHNLLGGKCVKMNNI